MILAAILGAMTLQMPVHGEARKFGLEDMLRLEGYGTAAIDPDGRWLVWEQLRPYDQNTDFSFRTYAFSKSGHQLWRLELSGDGEPERLPGLDKDPHSYQLGFSPSGDHLAVMQYRFGDLSLGVYDLDTDRYTRFGPTPAFGRAGEHNPVWRSDHELIYAALPEGASPIDTSVRAATGKWLAQSWRAAWDGTGVTALDVSTGGSRRDSPQSPGALVSADARTGETEILASGLYADLRLSPDRAWLAALAVHAATPGGAESGDVGDPRRYRLVLVDLRTKALRPVADTLEISPYSLFWSADGRKLGLFGWPTGQGAGEGRYHVLDLADGTLERYEHIGLDLASERERGWLQRPERAMFLGEDIVVFARPSAPDTGPAPRFTFRDTRPAGLARTDWYALSADGHSRNLTSGIAHVSPVPVHAGDGHVTVWSPDGVFRIYADGRQETLARPETGGLRHVPSGTFATRAAVIRPEFPGEAMFAVPGSGTGRLLLVALDASGGTGEVFSGAATGALPVAGSGPGNAMVYRNEDGPVTQLWLAEPGSTGPGRQIGSVNEHLKNVRFGDWRPVSYTLPGPDAVSPPVSLDACVLLPPGFDPLAPPPLVVDVYPNAAPRCGAGTTFPYPDPHSPYLWASKGFAYARVPTPRALIRTGEGPIAGIAEVVDAGASAVSGAGYADPDRMILTGFSQGAVAALYVAARSRLFRAVIAKNGWANLLSHYFGPMGIQAFSDPLYLGADAVRYDPDVGTDFAIGRTPFEDPGIYLRNSPVFLAPDIPVPVMLIHSDMDTFALSEFDQMFAALKKAGKQARYVRYLGEGHGPSSPANIRDMWDRKLEFLEENGIVP